MAKPKKGFLALRLVLWLAALAAVLTAVIVFVVYRDEIDSELVARLLPSIRLPGSAQESEQSETLAYDPMEDNIFAAVGDSLCVLNPRRLALQDGQNRSLVGRSVSFSAPTLSQGGRAALAYDRGGTSLLYLTDRELKLEKTYDGAILSARVNRRGFFSVVYQAPGSKTVAEVCDANGVEAFRFRSNERYLTDAVLSPENSRLAVAACEQRETGFVSSLLLYDIGTAELLAAVEFPDELILGLYYPDLDHIAVLLESGIEFFDGGGTLRERYGFGDRKLLGCEGTGSDFVALRVGRHASGIRNELVLLDWEGLGVMREEFAEPILSMSAQGSFLSVLVTGRVSLYDGTGTLRGETDADDARSVLQYADGGVLTLGLGRARQLTVNS